MILELWSPPLRPPPLLCIQDADVAERKLCWQSLPVPVVLFVLSAAQVDEGDRLDSVAGSVGDQTPPHVPLTPPINKEPIRSCTHAHTPC